MATQSEKIVVNRDGSFSPQVVVGDVDADANGLLADGNLLFAAAFSAIAITAAQDIFEIVAPAAKRVCIHEIRFGQYTDFGDAAAEILSIRVLRGYTTTGSGGAAVTPANVRKRGGTASGSTVARNNTTPASTGTPDELVADAVNIAAGWLYAPAVVDRLWLEPGERLVVRITAPADSLTCNGTLLFSEIS